MGATSSRGDPSVSDRNHNFPNYYPDGYYSPHSNASDLYHHPQTHHSNRKRLERMFSRIPDEYKSLEQVKAALIDAGLESSNLIIGIDFTKSNEWTGRRSYNRLNLHHIGEERNPYEQAISIIGKTLSTYDEDNLIPCFGFGDASTHDQDAFSFYPHGRPCNGFEEVLSRYREIAPHIRFSGPTSFAPIIEMATTIVEESGGQYHILLIVTDGQLQLEGDKAIVTRSEALRQVTRSESRNSLQEQRTIDAIVKASEYPLSIVLVGVGDGPWDMMMDFEDHIPQRPFDNFQFVNFTEIMMKNTDQMRKETEFALVALMDIPLQYKATKELGIVGRQNTGRSPAGRIALPTPNIGTYRRNYSSSSFGRSDSNWSSPTTTEATPSPTPLLDENERCPICWTNTKDMTFGCGHRTCCDCGVDRRLSNCPICRRNIEIRIKLH